VNFPQVGTVPRIKARQTFVARQEEEQRALARFNRERLNPGLGEEPGYCAVLHRQQMEWMERETLRQARDHIAPLLRDVPSDASGFIAWFERLKQNGPGQGDPLFPWLAEHASREQMRWFLEQEVAGEAGFDDLVAMTQVKMPKQAKLEMARNYWDEMGRGDARGMHGPMLEKLAIHLKLDPQIETIIPEALALGNIMVALAFNREFAFQSVGALGVIEMTAPGRSGYVARGLERLGVGKKHSHYFTLHAVLDVKHSEAWNREVLLPLVQEDPRRARALAEGALLRLWCGARCFARYRAHFQQAVH
jgi:hypothetical protein